MSEFIVQVVKVGPVTKHPNADTLSVTKPAGTDYPVIIRTGEFQEGDLVVYVPVDAVVPVEPRWEFLGEHRRIKAKNLRGIFSMGLFAKADPAWALGQDVREVMNISKYEPPEQFSMRSDNEKDPGFLPTYTDIVGLRAHPTALHEGEDVVLCEKLHGSNSRALYHNDRLWIGSHHGIKKCDPNNLWWKVAIKYRLEEKLKQYPGIVIYFETYGQVQDLTYGVPKEEGYRMAMFDALNIADRTYLNYDDFMALASQLGLPVAPKIYRGAWSAALLQHSEGRTLLCEPSQQHIREGFVVRPTKERFSPEVAGRAIFKMVGEGYLTRKGG